MYNTVGKRSNKDLRNLEFSHEEYKHNDIDEADPRLVVECEENNETALYKEVNRNTKK